MKECARPGYGLIYFGEKIPGARNGRGTRGGVPCNKSGRPLSVAHTYDDVNAHTHTYIIFIVLNRVWLVKTHTLYASVCTRRKRGEGDSCSVGRSNRAITSRQTRRQMVFFSVKIPSRNTPERGVVGRAHHCVGGGREPRGNDVSRYGL